MAIPKPGEPVTSLTLETAALDGPLSRHWPKRLARRLGVPLETARFWIYKGIPDTRRAEIAQALLAECTELEAVIAETRRRWSGIANEGSVAVGGDEVDSGGPQADRVGEVRS